MIDAWLGTYLATTSEDDIQAIHAIDQVKSYDDEVAKAIADAFVQVYFDGNSPEIERSGKQPWEV